MRTLIAATLAAACGLTPLSAVAFVERQPIQAVELEALRASPTSFLNLRVQFRAVFIEMSGIYDATHSSYSPERYLNFCVWDDEANLYDPQVRAKPLVTLYYDKQRAAGTGIEDIPKFTLIEVTADVSGTSRDLPWLNVHEVKIIAGAKRYDDNTIYHVEQAVSLAADGVRDLADARFATALTGDLPLHAQIAIGELRARNQMAIGDFTAAVKTLEKTQVLADSKLPTGEKTADEAKRGVLHYLTAKSLGEVAQGAEGDQRNPAFTTAVNHARAALKIDPTNGDAYAVLGICLAGLGRFDDAKQECAQAIRLQPANAEVRWYLGRILDTQGDYEGAIEALKKAIDLTPKDHRIHKAIAAAYHHRGQKGGPTATEDIQVALREYDIALRLNAEDADAAYESARVLETAAEKQIEVVIGTDKVIPTYDHAIARFQTAIQIDAMHVPSLLALVNRFQASGRTEEAMSMLNGLIEAEPDRIEFPLEHAKLLVAKGSHAEALEVLKTYRATHRSDAAILANLGRLALTVGMPSEGIEPLETLTADHPRNASAQLDLAECYLGTGQTRDAVKRARLGVEYAEGDLLTARAKEVLARAEEADNR